MLKVCLDGLVVVSPAKQLLIAEMESHHPRMNAVIGDMLVKLLIGFVG